MFGFTSGILLCCLSLLLPVAYASPALDQLINEQLKANAPGAAVAISQGGETVFTHARGFASMELQVALQPYQRFRIGSLTKQFTAAAILRLAEDGKLNLNQSLHHYLPDYVRFAKDINIKQLLQHTSGLANYTDDEHRYKYRLNDAVTLDEVVEELRKDPPLFTPGESFYYSNTGYVLLGRIIELVSGKSYAEYLSEQFFQPLGMKDTIFATQAVIPNAVSGYFSRKGQQWQAAGIDMIWPHASGSLVSSVQDLVKWNQALYKHKLLSEESLKLMLTPAVLNNGKAADFYGSATAMGIFVEPVLSTKVYAHSGQINGFNSYLLYHPDSDVTVVVLANTENAVDAVTLGRELLATQVGLELPKFDAVAATSTQQAECVGRYQRFGAELEIVAVKSELSAREQGKEMFRLQLSSQGKWFQPGTKTVFSCQQGKELLEYYNYSGVPHRHSVAAP
jgi:CubicO group peptidase (beta-lactamase class C family)